MEAVTPGIRGADKFVSVPDARLAYVEQGAGEPVVFVHGSMGDYRSWEGQMEAFSARHRAIAYSRRYHVPNLCRGDERDYTPMLHVADLIAVIKNLGLGQVHLVGHSYGGAIAIMTASEHPELVRTLILGEPPLFALLTGNPKAAALPPPLFLDQATRLFRRGNLESGVRRFLEGVLGEGMFEQLPARVQQINLENAREMRVELLSPRESFIPGFTAEQARQVNIPTFLVGGDRSPAFLRLITDELEGLLPEVERISLPGVSHGLQYEDPVRFNEAVLSFLEQHSGLA